MSALSEAFPAFAGYFCETGNLIVLATPNLTSNSATSLLEEIESSGVAELCRTRFAPGRIPELIIRTVAHSFTTLRTYRDSLSEDIFKVRGVHSLGIDYPRNRIEIGLDTDAPPADVDALVSAKSIPPELAVAVSEPSPRFMESVTDRVRPAPGGFQSQTYDGVYTPGGFCTVNSATSKYISGYGYKRGWLTASHCVPVPFAMQSDSFYQANWSLDLVGYEYSDPVSFPVSICQGAQKCRSSDAAWVSAINNNDPQQGAIARTQWWGTTGPGSKTVDAANPRFRVAGTISPFVIGGMQVDKVGRSTGWTTGQVTNPCYDNVVNSSLYGTFRFFCNVSTDLYGDEGDSGGPVFYWPALGTGKSVYYMGVHSAGALGGNYMVFSPWSQVTADLGTLDVGYNGGFEQVTSESATDVGVGANASVWIIGNTPSTFGYPIKTWNGAGWTTVAGAAVRIAVDPNGQPWVINSYYQIYKWTGSAWQSMPGLARDIGIGANGAVWIVGTASAPGGYQVLKWSGSSWTLVEGGAIRIAVDSRGDPWITAGDNTIWKRSYGTWTQLPGSATDIGVGPYDGTVWVIGTSPTGGGYSIYRLNGTDWIQAPGGATAISVGVDGPWLVNSLQKIFRWL